MNNEQLTEKREKGKGKKERREDVKTAAAKKTAVFLFLFFFFHFSFAFAQTAAELDALLETDAVSAAVAARFVLGAADLLPPELSGGEAERAAYDTALSNGWVTNPAGGNITLRGAAFLVMGAFDFKGGVLYSLLRNPRYAYREMIYKRIIQGRADPEMTVSGTRLLQIIGRALNYAGEEDPLEAVR